MLYVVMQIIFIEIIDYYERMTFMWNIKLALSASASYGRPVTELIENIADAGFDGFFAVWYKGCPIKEWRETADRCNIEFQSIHAPTDNIAKMWSEDMAEGTAALTELLECLSDCAKYNVPIMVVHAFIGFEDHTPTQIGLERFGALVQASAECGVKIAFENTEGEEYLEAVMDAFKGFSNVGFCWDSGHEMCYNHSKDLLDLYGDRLIAMHLNDNLGIRSYDGSIVWTDDLHLLPFDGIGDWDYNAKRLARASCPEFLTFELKREAKPNSHCSDKYIKVSLEEYLAEAYARACKVGAKTLRAMNKL